MDHLVSDRLTFFSVILAERELDVTSQKTTKDDFFSVESVSRHMDTCIYAVQCL